MMLAFIFFLCDCNLCCFYLITFTIRELCDGDAFEKISDIFTQSSHTTSHLRKNVYLVSDDIPQCADSKSYFGERHKIGETFVLPP